MKNLSLLILQITLLLSLASCGKSDSEKAADQANADIDKFSNQYLSGECGLNIVSDYNSMVIECGYMLSRTDIEDCESKIVQFKEKYPGINCTAEEGYGLDTETININEQHLNSILNEVQNL